MFALSHVSHPFALVIAIIITVHIWWQRPHSLILDEVITDHNVVLVSDHEYIAYFFVLRPIDKFDNDDSFEAFAFSH